MTKKQFTAITTWQRETFNPAGPLSVVEHLADEVQELKADIVLSSHLRRLEFADCFILLYGAAQADGMSYEDITAAIEEKFKIVKARAWGKPDARGVINHIKPL